MPNDVTQGGPLVLIVRDGWGRNPHHEHDAFNAVKLARTPVGDGLLKQYPWTLIKTSGKDVGLPDGTMGNSEVGHQNLGAGRIVDQESVRITNEILAGGFFDNSVLIEAVRRAKGGDRYVHLLGIASDAGVHGRLGHLYACLELCRKLEHDKVALHLFTDGRDTGPGTGKVFIQQIEDKCRRIGVGKIVSICGRYYAMDRDNRWERVARAYQLFTGGGHPPGFDDAVEAVADYYDHPTNDSQQGDEFITPRTVGEDWRQTRIGSGDSVVFYNYRGDRPREITRAFVLDDDRWAAVKPSPDSGRHGFDRGPKLDVHYVTMTAYEAELAPYVHVAYPKPPKLQNIAGQQLADMGLRQFRCAETEKFPHVTFFFNDYRDQPFDGEGRQMAQSPKVATYDLQPQMSAHVIADIVESRLQADDREDFILVNFANGDMVGHTGKIQAAINAVETVDRCVGQIVDVVVEQGGRLIVTADHGNAEQMFDPDTNSPHTAHTTYDVECIIVDPRFTGDATGDVDKPSGSLRSGGRLADVMPTALKLMGLAPPAEMTGHSLLI